MSRINTMRPMKCAAIAFAALVLVCPAGFVSDHLEVLYDLDVDTARVAREQAIAFDRTGTTPAVQCIRRRMESVNNWLEHRFDFDELLHNAGHHWRKIVVAKSQMP